MSAGSFIENTASAILPVLLSAGACISVFLLEGWRQSIIRRISRLERKTEIHESWLTAILRSFFDNKGDKDDHKKS